mmetsp:Transcript_24577/g.68053  ORF Transcript_24577/g.68053 Transcript_24577/m.68053 type:complete len:588 (-) Transcript_24577:140-1903(-)
MEGFIQEQETPLPEDVEFGHSKVFSVSRREGDDVWESVLYVRRFLARFEEKVAKELWKNQSKSRLYVNGPPGCGKTCFFYLWARLRSVQDNARVLIVQFREKEPCFIWIREAGGKLWRLNEAIEAADLRLKVKEITSKNKEAGTVFDLCIHDGVLDGKDFSTQMISTCNTAVSNKAIRKVVHVTSLAFSLSTGGQRLGLAGSIMQESVDSWLLDDFFEAIKCKKFASGLIDSKRSILSKDRRALGNDDDDDDGSGPSEVGGEDEMSGSSDEVMDDGDSGEDETESGVSWTEVVETKYYYAGGSARFMFDFQLSELKGELDKRCNKVQDDQWKYFAHEAVASGTPAAVNTLMQQFDGKASPVSKYILFKAYEKCRTDLVNAVTAIAKGGNNPALKGWAFELQQIDLIRSSFESSPDLPEYVTNNKGLSFRPVSEIDFDENTLGDDGTIQEDGTIIWCQKWNQGCFDVAFYQGSTLVTLQFTVAEEHSLKPKFIRRLRDALLSSGITVDTFVHVGVGEADGFRFELSSSGTGRQGNALQPQFTISAYHSPPLEKRSARSPVGFQANLSPMLEKVDMWELSNSKRRRKNQ